MPSELASDPENKVMFLSFYPRKEDVSSGVIHARLNLKRDRERLSQSRDAFIAEWEKMFSLGKQELQTFLHIRDAGFVPDMIFISFFDGPALFLRHIFPRAFIVFYFSGFRSKAADAGRLQAVMDLQRGMAAQSNLYFVRSEAQKTSFPPALHPIIHVWPPHVNTGFFAPRPRSISMFFADISIAEGTELVTVHMKGAGSSQKNLMQVILGLLAHRPRCLAALTFGNGTAKDRWGQVLSSLPEDLRRRLFLAGGLDATAYRNLLCSSAVHIFPEHIRPPLQEMLETMGCGTLLMTPVSKEADEFLKDGETIAAFPEEGRERQLEAICRVLDHTEAFDPIREKGRRYVAEKCSDRAVFSHHLNFVMEEYRKFRETSPAPQPVSHSDM